MITVKYVLSLNYFEIDEFEVIVDISLSNFINVKGPSGYLELSGSESRD